MYSISTIQLNSQHIMEKKLIFIFLIALPFLSSAQRFKSQSFGIGYSGRHFTSPLAYSNTTFEFSRYNNLLHSLRMEYYFKDQVAVGAELGYIEKEVLLDIKSYNTLQFACDVKYLSPGLFRNRLFLHGGVAFGRSKENTERIFSKENQSSLFVDLFGGLTLRPIKQLAISYDLPALRYQSTEFSHTDSNGNFTGSSNQFNFLPFRFSIVYLFNIKK